MLWTIVKIILALPLFIVLFVLSIPGLIGLGLFALLGSVLTALGFGDSLEALIADVKSG